jgi:hypothetical protein
MGTKKLVWAEDHFENPGVDTGLDTSGSEASVGLL